MTDSHLDEDSVLLEGLSGYRVARGKLRASEFIRPAKSVR